MMRRESDTDSTDENDHDGALASDDEGIRVSTPNPELSGLDKQTKHGDSTMDDKGLSG